MNRSPILPPLLPNKAPLGLLIIPSKVLSEPNSLELRVDCRYEAEQEFTTFWIGNLTAGTFIQNFHILLPDDSFVVLVSAFPEGIDSVRSFLSRKASQLAVDSAEVYLLLSGSQADGPSTSLVSASPALNSAENIDAK